MRVFITAKPCISLAQSAVYHQHEVLYLIKPQEICTLARDDIQPTGLMIYRLAADDIPSLRLG